MSGLRLIAAVCICLPPMLIALGTRDVARVMENVCLLSSGETWLRQHGWHDIPKDEHAWLLPTANGRLRVVKPPMLVWLNMAAWSDLTPSTSHPQELAHRARLVAMTMALLALIATFWIGRTLDDDWLGTLAVLIGGTSWFFLRQARTASYDIHMLGWATMAAAWAIWSIGPRVPTRSAMTRCLGWGLAGVALGAAWLSKGPLSLVLVILPVAATIVMTPQDRRKHLAGAGLMIAVAAAVALPWYAYMWNQKAHAVQSWLGEYRAARRKYQPPYYYLALLALLLPWSVWLVAGLLHPWMSASGGERRRRLIPWLWFLGIFVFFSIPAAKQQRYILPIVPAAALLTAQVLHDHHRAAAAGQTDAGARFLHRFHLIALLVASVVLGPLLASQDWLVKIGVMSKPFTAPVPWGVSIAITALLIGLTWLAWRWYRRDELHVATIVFAAWMAAAMTLFSHAYANQVKPSHAIIAEAQRVEQTIGTGSLGSLKKPDLAYQGFHDNEEFLFYLRRIIRPFTPQQLQDPDAAPAFVTAEAGGHADRLAKREVLTADVLHREGLEHGLAVGRVAEVDAAAVVLDVRGPVEHLDRGPGHGHDGIAQGLDVDATKVEPRVGHIVVLVVAVIDRDGRGCEQVRELRHRETLPQRLDGQLLRQRRDARYLGRRLAGAVHRGRAAGGPGARDGRAWRKDRRERLMALRKRRDGVGRAGIPTMTCRASRTSAPVDLSASSQAW